MPPRLGNRSPTMAICGQRAWAPCGVVEHVQRKSTLNMERPPEELHLSDSYQFSVTVKNEGNCFAGKLRLSPDECSLVISGDLYEGRSANFGWRDIDHVTCNGHDVGFLLYGLKFVG